MERSTGLNSRQRAQIAATAGPLLFQPGRERCQPFEIVISATEHLRNPSVIFRQHHTEIRRLGTKDSHTNLASGVPDHPSPLTFLRLFV